MDEWWCIDVAVTLGGVSLHGWCCEVWWSVVRYEVRCGGVL